MEGSALDDRERARPPGTERLVRDGLADPAIGPLVLGCELRKRERASYSTSELVRHGHELEPKALRPSGIGRGLGKAPMGIRPVMPRALDVRSHERAG